MSNFIVYKRSGNRVTPHTATLTRDGVRVGAAVPWADLYGGHTGWVGEQIERVKRAIKQARARRTLRRNPDGATNA